MKGGKIPLVATFETCFDDHVKLDMIRVAFGSNNGNPKTAPPTLHGNAHSIVTSMEHKFETNRLMQKRTKIGKMQ